MIVTRLRVPLAVGAALALAMSSAAVAVPAATPVNGHTLPSNTQFYVRHPDDAALAQIGDLRNAGDKTDANLLSQMLNVPQAVWFTSGTPSDVYGAVKNTVKNAAAKGTVPVLVAYNVPGRDCANYSAGGALNLADYEAWIDAFAAGIGNAKAVIILEPDGIGLLPQANCGSNVFTDADRYAELNHAVDALEAKPNTLVYLDATHPDWMNVGDITTRLLTAGVQAAQGFFLNVSNFQFTSNSASYGTWISGCIALVTQLGQGAGGCPNQYWNGGPATGWDGDAMSAYQAWSSQPYSGNHSDLLWNTVGIDSRYALMLGGTRPTTHFVVDTSRNGVGPWQPNGSKQTLEDWCNPPDRGLGPRPAVRPDASFPLVDAYLWVKTPGESDGQCHRGTAGPADPVRGYVDPAAGQWFPQQALELAQLANPPLPAGRP